MESCDGEHSGLIETHDGKYCGPVQIYKLTAPNGKVYVGQTQCYKKRSGVWKPAGLQERWKQHQRDALGATYTGNCRHLVSSLRKYGPSTFQAEIIATVQKDKADQAEIDQIAEAGSLAPNGLNLREGGQGSAINEESRQRMRASALARRRTSEERVAMKEGRRAAIAARTGLPSLISISKANPKKGQAEGFRVAIYSDRRVAVKSFCRKEWSMDYKLAIAVSARDTMLDEKGLPPVT